MKISVSMVIAFARACMAAFVAYQISRKKGRDTAFAVVFGVLGFFLDVYVLFGLALMQDWSGPSGGLAMETAPQPKPLRNMKRVYVRNCYVHSPLRPCYADVYTEDGKLVHMVAAKAYDDSVPQGLLAEVVGFDAAGNRMYSMQQFCPQVNVAGTNLFQFEMVIGSPTGEEQQALHCIEVYILEYVIGVNVVQQENRDVCLQPATPEDLVPMKQRFGADALVPLAQEDNRWTCVCGTDTEARYCPLCGRTLVDITDSAKSVNAFIMALDNINRVPELQEEFAQVKTLVSAEAAEEIEKIIANALNLERLYGIKLEAEQKEKIRQLLL